MALSPCLPGPQALRSAVLAVAQNQSDADCPALIQKEVTRHVGPSKIPCVIHQTWRSSEVGIVGAEVGNVGKDMWKNMVSQEKLV